ncbi:serine/threonine-protein kinase [Nocardia sp. NPDC052001]|uniref:serine/threonine-protein kinase n=1 Tax=Nocardia sp. NPDC052001 TaxID=3154853 RepID=UPI0034448839
MSADVVEAIGPYRVIGRLGSGGMGDVLLGRSPGGRQVALKVVHRHLARDAEFRTRFAREVQAARAVGGFYTAAVVDADWEAPQPWLATEYIAGHSLKDVVADFGPLPEASVEELAAGIVEALAAIHTAGVTHRDLTPGNVLLTESGPRVIDFGIAKLVAETQAVTTTGALIGTPGYMSPEHVLGGDIGPAGDVFSLGSVLTFAATGHAPFEDKSTALMLMRVAYSAPDLTGLREGRLNRIIVACLHKDAAARPSTSDLLEALRDHRAGASAQWLPPPMMAALAAPPSVEPLMPQRRSNRRAVLTAGIGGAVILMGAAVATGKLIADRSSAKAPAAVRSPGGTLRWQADIGTFVGTDYSPDPPAVAGTAVFAGSIDGSVYALDGASGAVRWKGVMRQQLSHGPVQLDGKVYATNVMRGLFAFDAATGAELWEKPDISGAVAAAGGLVFGSLSVRGNGIVAFDSTTGEQRWVALTDASTSSLSIFAAEGAVVTVTGGGELCLLDAATGAVRWRMTDPKDGFHVVDPPIISGGAVFVSTANTFRALDLGTGAQKWKFDRFGGSATVVRGNTVFVAGYSRAYAFDAADGTVRWLYRSDDNLSSALAVGTDSVYCLATEKLLALDITSGEQRWVYQAPDKLGGITFGSGVVFAGCDDRNLYAINA